MERMADFEKLGVFYLGRRADAAGQAAPVLYDSRDLVTHALAVGMTGSGKTGLGIALIEEAAIDGVPAIVIDPKGDLTNLLLTFPSLDGKDFEPWINGEEAERAGKTRAEFAAGEAARWKKGLADWGQDGARITRLREAADFAVYTPGSAVGRPVSVLGTFARPATDEPEAVRERVQTSVSSLLALAGIDAEPMKGREHILLSAVLQAAWDAGQSPDLAGLVQAIQQPPMTRIGVIDVDSFFPPKDRFGLAMSLNALLASPVFEVWTKGDPLDVAAFLRTPAGKPRVSIFSIAHLDDTQRMFFVAMLLNAVTGWMRAQGGTSSLRAMLYMDEIFGFFPPVANPPSKVPLLTLLKQGRAMGLGVVLATQNPVDLDYKGLSNIGTWFLGRLQTDRDKARVLDGLESADATAGASRAEIDRMLSGLTSRIFLMRNVHDDGLTLLQSRWALSYLRGPLGRDDLKRLTLMTPMSPVSQASGAPGAPRAAGPTPGAGAAATGGTRPVVPPDVPQFFAPDTGSGSWQPIVYGAADVVFADKKLKVDVTKAVVMAAPIAETAVPVDWANAEPLDVAPDALVGIPPGGTSVFAAVPSAALKAKNYAAWSRQFVDWLVANQQVTLFRHGASGQTSLPDETERDFRARLQQAAREDRDRRIDALRKKYAPRQAALDERLRRAKQALDREQEQSSAQKMNTAISFGATLVGALLGRRAISAGTVGRATTAARGVGRAQKEAQDVSRARETIAAVEADRQRLEDDLRADTDAIDAVSAGATEPLESVVVKPKKTGVTVKLVALVWK
jgi:hypothetical protein